MKKKKKMVTFQHNVLYMVNSFVVSLDITVMVNILVELVETLYKKNLKATNLY